MPQTVLLLWFKHRYMFAISTQRVGPTCTDTSSCGDSPSIIFCSILFPNSFQFASSLHTDLYSPTGYLLQERWVGIIFNVANLRKSERLTSGRGHGCFTISPSQLPSAATRFPSYGSGRPRLELRTVTNCPARDLNLRPFWPSVYKSDALTVRPRALYALLHSCSCKFKFHNFKQTLGTWAWKSTWRDNRGEEGEGRKELAILLYFSFDYVFTFRFWYPWYFRHSFMDTINPICFMDDVI